MNIFKEILGKNDEKDSNWTDLSKPPREVFQDGCELIAKKLEMHGFEYSKSGSHLIKKSQNGDFRFKITFGSITRNKKGELVELNIYFQVISNKIKEFRGKLFKKFPERNLGKPDNLITSKAFGYVTDSNSYIDWNLITSDPYLIASQLEKFAIPSFEKFEDLEFLLKSLSENGLLKEFDFEFRALDFLMCFSGPDLAHKGLVKMLTNRNWTDDFNKLYADLENGKEMIDKRHFLTILVERAFLYGLALKY
jgi:hypothetical protein